MDGHPTPDTHRTPTGGHPHVSGRTADRLAAALYVAVAVVALIGQSTAAVHWTGWPWWTATPIVGVVELSAVALAARADYRRRLGEKALAARALSAAVAALMTGVNVVGHTAMGQHLSAAVFGGATALGYAVWLIMSADRRRDQLLATGQVRPSTPDYGAWQWLLHPAITLRARALARQDVTLGLYGSLSAAREQIRAEKRRAAIARILRRKLSASVDPVTADMAVHTYDLDEVATRLAGQADYDGLTALVAADLTPDRLAGIQRTSRTGRRWTGKQPDTGQASPVRPDTREDVKPVGDGKVVAIAGRTPRRAGRPDTEQVSGPVSVKELADTLGSEHGPVRLGKPKALMTLRQVYGSCSADRAVAAKDEHNKRHGFGDESADDDKERVA